MRLGIGVWLRGRPVAASTAWNWQPIYLTAGTDGSQWVGYSDGGATRPAPAFGSISGQPTSVTDLLALYDDTNSDVYLAVFEGDYATRMAGMTLDIGGTVFEPFEVEVIAGNTWLRYDGVGDLLPGQGYEVIFGSAVPPIENPTLGLLTEGDRLGDHVIWGSDV